MNVPCYILNKNLSRKKGVLHKFSASYCIIKTMLCLQEPTKTTLDLIRPMRSRYVIYWEFENLLSWIDTIENGEDTTFADIKNIYISWNW